MPYQIWWHVTDRVIAARFYGDLTLKDIEASTQEGQKMLDQGTAPVHTLIDMTDLTGYPLKISEIYAATLREVHPNSGWTMIYGVRSRVVKTMLAVLNELFPYPYRIVDSFEEALDFLAEQDPTLPPLR